MQDLAENHLDGVFFGSFPSGNGINGSDFVAELQAFHNKVFAPQTIIGTSSPGNHGVGGRRVGAVHSGSFVPVVPRGGSPIFSTATSPSNGGDPPAFTHFSKKAKRHTVVQTEHRHSLLTRIPSHARRATLGSTKNHPTGATHEIPRHLT